jgi:DNA replication protein DnaC
MNEVILTIIAAASLIFGIYQYRKNQQLEREKEIKKELKEKQAEDEGKAKKKSYVEHYCDHIKQKFKYLDFTGLNAILQKPLLLEDIYVKLRAQKSYKLTDYRTIADFKLLDEERASADGKGWKEKTTKPTGVIDGDFAVVFESIYNEAVQKQEPLKMVILGQPGSGKTTLMKWIALQSVSSAEGIFSRFMPVFIPLKDLGREPDKTFRSKNIRDLTLEMLIKVGISDSFLEEFFENNGLIFLLDGLDEVADESIRKEVIQWIQDQHIRRNTILVTSRFSGLQEAKGLKFHDAVPVFVVQDFDIADIERFLENWYKNIEAAVIGDTCEEDRERAIKEGKARYEDLMKIIKDKNYENLHQLAVNPLLLTIIAIVHRTRAVLPKERHKLYDECLRVMIELWNVANRKLDVNFSVGNSLDNLSKLAVYLMKENRREMELSEIKGLLTAEIEGKSLDVFLKEMVLKSGLLYESEGKYGFLHLTFQEYLAACYFAGEENPNHILEYRDRDYWTETFKLFANTGNVHHFFNEIIDNLEEKKYWRQMQLWDACLQDTALEKKQGEIEVKFAKKILSILPQIEYKEENEELIVRLFAHYSLYKHAGQFIDDAWNLFHHALHPFGQSVGSSILKKAGKEVQSDLIKALKERIEAFEKKENEKDDELLDFLYQNNNSFLLMLAARRKLPDFYWALEKLKSGDLFIKFLVLRSLRSLRILLALLDILDIMSLMDILNSLDLLDVQNLSSLRDFLDIHGLRDIHYLQDIRALCDQYKCKYEAILKKHKKEIEEWAIRAAAKLHSLSGDELLHYFPGTTPDEIKVF